jgi:hypothetical protein
MRKKMKKSIRTKGDLASKEIQRIWGDVPVVDAKKDLRVVVQPCDVGDAKVKDPGHCVFARACRRSFGSTKVLFFRQVAYVELPCNDGTKRVERFLLTHAMRELIATFDRGQPVLPEGGFELKAPNPSHTLAGMKADKVRRKATVREAMLRGESSPVDSRMGVGSGKKRYSHKYELDLEVRSGSGQVHFTPAR